jgi:hypothetical protein
MRMVDCNQELSESDDLIPFSFLVTMVACVSWTICDTHTAINLIPTPMFLSLSPCARFLYWSRSPSEECGSPDGCFLTVGSSNSCTRLCSRHAGSLGIHEVGFASFPAARVDVGCNDLRHCGLHTSLVNSACSANLWLGKMNVQTEENSVLLPTFC